ncbi:methyltransferase domain-containing protein [Streptomyces sp. NPDC051569]|uniref:methyltransferase domain-containing protein n=1 Tax=Streptomyces sp. NPDC051569 TaxID=3365661 RepID=UPI00378FB42E
MTTDTTPTADDLRRLMTERLVSSGDLASYPWREAFASVPRHAFVPAFTVRSEGVKHTYDETDAAWLAAAYGDVSLLTQFDEAGTATSSSTQPSLMARMLEALFVRDRDTVLEIGTGTGYNAALLSHRLGADRVTSVDIDPDLVDAARERLRSAGYEPTLIAGDGMAGCDTHAPYDRLLATCGVGRIPDAWRAQVRPGGVIVANVGLGIARLSIEADHSACGPFLTDCAAFMSARPTPDTIRNTAQSSYGALLTWTGEEREITLVTTLGAEVPQLLASLAQPNVMEFTLTADDGRTIRCLLDAQTSSWARITQLDPTTAHLEHGGPRDLWAERVPLLTHWVAAGRPGAHRYGLTITAAGHCLWLDSPRGDSWHLT